MVHQYELWSGNQGSIQIKKHSVNKDVIHMHCHIIFSTNDLPYITNEVCILLYFKHPDPGRYCQNYHVVHVETVKCLNKMNEQTNKRTNE